VKDPFILEFLNLKDEYSESDLESALVAQLELFLLELGGDFAFIGRQRRLRVGDEWYRVDLLFFHRRLRSLVVIDLKLGRFTHADAGQMHLYLNYAREHWTLPDENPPVGLILCAQKDEAVAHYALEGLKNKVLAAEYRTTLPDEKTLIAELERSTRRLETRLTTAESTAPHVLQEEAATPKNRHTTSTNPLISEERLKELVEEATVDCHDESEQANGLFIMLTENLATPFKTTVLGTEVTVERVDIDANDHIIAECVRGKRKQRVSILDLPLPTPPPDGAEWIEAYRRWSRPNG
jgi:hypothetical protein